MSDIKEGDGWFEIPACNQEVDLEGEHLAGYELLLDIAGWIKEEGMVQALMVKNDITKEVAMGTISTLISKELIWRKTINGTRRWYLMTPKAITLLHDLSLPSIYR